MMKIKGSANEVMINICDQVSEVEINQGFGSGSGSARIRMFLPCPDPDPGKKVRK